MAIDLNQCNFIGRLGADADIRYTQAQMQVANFSIATALKTKDTDHTEWVRCVAFDRLANVVSEYTKKGSRVFVSGRMQTRKWTDNDGVVRYSTEIILRDLQLLDSRSQEGPAQRPSSAARSDPAPTDFDDDIPF